MTTSLRAALAALLLIAGAVPALAHNGLIHGGCDPAANFSVGDLTVSGGFTRATLPGAQSAGGYFTITNAGAMPDRLIGASSAAAKVIQVHEMKMDGDMMKMGEVAGGVEIPAGGSVVLEPRGLHMMMMGLGAPFAEGACVEVTLEFATAGALPVVLAIGGTAATEPSALVMDMAKDMIMDHAMDMDTPK